MGDFAGIPWGKQGQCCLTPSGKSPLGKKVSVLQEILQVFQVGDFAEILFPGVNKVSVV